MRKTKPKPPCEVCGAPVKRIGNHTCSQACMGKRATAAHNQAPAPTRAALEALAIQCPGLDQGEMARRVGVTRQRVSQILKRGSGSF
jgi:hypothetical protein